MSFKDFNFKDYIQEALDEIKFKEPTPVQQKLIPVVRSGRDLVGEFTKRQNRLLNTLIQKFVLLITSVVRINNVRSRNLR